MKKIIFLLWLLVVFAAGVWAGDSDTALVRTMNEAKFSTDQLKQVQTMIETARQQGLPADALSSKVHEGVAKNIDPDRIIEALDRVTDRYHYSYSLAYKITRDKKQAVELGNTMTAGIAAGLRRQDAEKIVDSLQARSRKLNSEQELYRLTEESMLMARDMSRQGISSATSAEVIGKAVQKGFAAKEMQTMRHTFNKQAVHANRESLARGYGAAIERGMQANELAHGNSMNQRGRDGTGPGGSSDNSGSSGNSEAGSGSGNSGSSGASGGSNGDSSGSDGAGSSSGDSGSSEASGGAGNGGTGGNSGGSGSSGGKGGGRH
jgi:uncharacterized membrane protein YgcG